jgi:hypothetical protein
MLRRSSDARVLGAAEHSRMSYDVIVIHALWRLANRLAAGEVNPQGVLLDKARFPSDTLSTEYIHQRRIARLAAGAVRARRTGTAHRPFYA